MGTAGLAAVAGWCAFGLSLGIASRPVCLATPGMRGRSIRPVPDTMALCTGLSEFAGYLALP